MAEPFEFRRSRGSYRARNASLGTWLLALVLWAAFDAAWWICAVVVPLSLPTALKFWRGAEAVLTLDARGLTWSSGQRVETITQARIESVRLRTAMDFAQRATVETATARHRVPPECIPPGQTLDAALTAQGITFDRRLFGF